MSGGAAMFVAVERFPALHGFTTRAGGVSSGPFASLNFGRAVGDEPAAISENARRLAAVLGVRPGQLTTVQQVHGDRILEVAGHGEGDDLPPPLGEADGMVSRAPGAVLCIQTADCVPVLFHAPDISAVGAVHAGWRGTLAGIASRAVRRLEAWGADPAKLHVAIGPCIHRCCYEVDEALGARFRDSFGGRVVLERTGAKPHLDLVEANRIELLNAGVGDARLVVEPSCTSCDGRFFSHRRDQGRSGRQLSFVALGRWSTLQAGPD